jgi:hypothetical protein
MIRDLLKRALLLIAFFSLGGIVGYNYAQSEIIRKALANKKPCYDLYDIYLFIK